MEKNLEGITNLLQDKSMNFILKPSLEHITLVKIATILWNQNDIRTLMATFLFPSLTDGEWREILQEIEDKVMKKLLQISQPAHLKEKILGLIKPIGFEIVKWLEYHKKYCCLRVGLPTKFCWTPQGTVDKKKTAELLIQDERLDTITRYKLACIYCLDDDIPQFWNKISEDCRHSFLSQDFPSEIRQQHIVVHWTYDIRQDMVRMNKMVKRRLKRRYSPNQYAFEFAANCCNETTTKYFFHKLTPREKEESLLNTAENIAGRCFNSYRSANNCPKNYYTEVLCFLLSQLDKEQQMEIFECYSYQVLEYFINYPFQRFFMESANHMWNFVSPDEYYNLLKIIINKVINGYTDYNYQNLFTQFWIHSPDSYKKYIINKCILDGTLLSELFKIEDKENIRLIMKNVSVEEKYAFAFNNDGKVIFEHLFFSNKWDLLKFFFEECVSSENVIIMFKNHFMLSRPGKKLQEEKDMWHNFFKLLDDLIYQEDKRIV